MRFLADVRVLTASSPPLRRYVLSDGLIAMAELQLLVLLPWWVANAGGAADLARMGVFAALVALVGGPLLAPWGDRFCKARQIRLGVLVLVGAALVLTWLAASGRYSLPPLLALVGLQVLARAFVDPARETLPPELVSSQDLPTLIRLRKSCLAVCGMTAPLLAAAAMGAGGVVGGLGLHVGLLLSAWWLASGLPRGHCSDVGGGWRAWRFSLVAGLRAKWQVPMERGWTVVNFVVWIFQGPAVGMLIPVKIQSMGLSGSWLGLGLGVLSLGSLLGGLLGSQWLVERLGRYRVRVGLGCAEGLALMLVGLAGSPPVLLAGLLFTGFCNAAMALVGATHRALAIPRSHRVRMVAASAMTTQIAGAVGPAVAGAALLRWSVDLVYPLFGLLMAVSVLGFLWVPRLREFLGLSHTQVDDWYRREYPQVFR